MVLETWHGDGPEARNWLDTLVPVVEKMRRDLAGFCVAALRLRGRPEAMGSAAFSFQVLPRVSLAVVYWQGDEDFVSRAQVLFDASAGHYLPTDGLAVLGSRLVDRLIARMARSR